MKKIKRPSIFLFITEMFRAFLELRKALPFIKKYTVQQKGDGHSILVIPGFLASDLSTKPLRRFLIKLGYNPCGWEMGTNLGDLSEIATLEAKIDNLYADSGQKVSLIGWSLGGVYARELAKAKGDKIRQVITLGSPFNGINEPNNANLTFNFIKWIKGYPEPDEALIASLPLPAPQPTTAIYSKKDGIVPWESCIESVEDATHQNVEVKSSHLGMGVNVEVLKIVAERLYAQQKESALIK